METTNPAPQRIRSTMQEVRDGLRCSTIEAMFATVHVGLTQGIFLTSYLVDLGAPNLIFGLVESLPSFLQFTFILSPLLVARLQARKPVATFFAFAHRLSWMVLVLLLYLDLPVGTKLALAVLVLLFSNVCANVAANAWYSWMVDLVPSAVRGSYYGRRNSYLGITSMVTIFLGTQLLTVFRDTGQGRFGYTFCFGTAGISAAFAAYVLLRVHEPRINVIPDASIRGIFGSIKHNTLLKQYVGFFTLWQFAMGIGSAFFNLHMIRILKMSPAQIGYLVLVASVSSLIGSRVWGRVMDRVGARCVILATGTLIAFHIWFYVFAWQGFLWPLWIANVFGGFFWGGFGIASFVWPQRLAAQQDQQQAYGFLGLLAGLGFALGSVFGGVLTTLIPQIVFRIGPYVFTHYQVVFILSSIGRLIAILWISEMSLSSDRHGRTIPQAIRDSFRAIQQTFSKQFVSLL
jgi:hypothetical protein